MFSAIIVTLPLALPVTVIERSGIGLTPEHLSTPIYASDILLVCLILCWALHHALSPTRALRLPARPLAIVLASLAALVTLSTAWAVVPGIAATAAIRWLLHIGLALYVVDKVREHRSIAVWMAVGGTLHAAVVSWKLLAPAPVFLELYPSPFVLGLYLAVGLLAVAGLVATDRRLRPRYLFAVALIGAGLLAMMVSANAPVAEAGSFEPEPAALTMLRRRPLGGVGIGNSPVTASLLGLVPEGKGGGQSGGSQLLIAAELGLVGGGLWLALWALILVGSLQGRAQLDGQRLDGQRLWWRVWTSAVLATGFLSWRDTSLLAFPQGGVLLWMVIGLWASAARPSVVWHVPRLPATLFAPDRTRPQRRDGLVFAAVTLGVGLVFIALYVLLIRTRGPLLWDQASFALTGADVLRAVRHGDWPAAAEAAGRADQYPPGYPVLAAGWFWLVGVGQAQIRLLSLAWSGLAIALGFWLAWGLSPDDRSGRRAGVICAALMLSSPTLIYLSTDAVLEPAGAALTLATLAAAALAGGQRRTGWLAVAGALAAATCMVKYNYGLPLVASLCLVTLLDAAPPPVHRRRSAVLAVTALLPLALWLAFDPVRRLSGLIGFAVNRSSGLGSAANLAVYPQALLYDFAATWWIGLGLMVSAGIGIHRYWRTPRLQPAIVYVILFLSMALVHPYKQPRFLFTAVPVLMVLGSIVIGTAIESAFRSPRKPWRPFVLVTIALTSGMLAAFGVVNKASVYQHGDNEWLNFEPNSRRTVEDMLTFVGAGVDPRKGVLLSGVSNEFSSSLLAWSWSAEQGVEPVRLFGLPGIGPSSRTGRVAATMQEHADALRGSLALWRPASAVSVTVAPDSAFYTTDYELWNAWQLAYDVVIEQDMSLLRRDQAWFDGGRIHITLYCNVAVSDCR